MNQEERLDYLIKELCQESAEYQHITLPNGDRKRILRSLMNIRMPKPIRREFLTIQDDYLKEEARTKGIVSLNDIPTIQEQYGRSSAYASRISIWQGDITRLSADAIVNAANSKMLGCFIPCHGCIDNAIHSAAGMELRAECNTIMLQRNCDLSTGEALITKGYNLPAKYVIHTVGPIVYPSLNETHKQQLTACYRSCLELAEQYELKSIAFCCISTGEFRFPNDIAASIAVRTVLDYLPDSRIERVIFNVFKEEDLLLYQQLL